MKIRINLTIKIVALVLLASLSAKADQSEIIYLVYNNNESKDVMVEDSMHIDASLESLKELLKEMNSNLEIRPLPLNSLFDLPKEIKTNLGKSKLRGVVFMGHGNNTSYAFSNEEIFGGNKKIIEIIKPLLSKTITADKLLLYFSGCSMGGGKSSFQEELISSLAKIENNKIDVEIIAHIYSINMKGGAHSRPSFIDRIAIKTKIGIFVERFMLLPSRFVGGYAPTVMNVLVGVGIPGLLLLTGNSSKYDMAFLFIVVPAMSILSGSASKLGYSKGFTDNAKGFVFDLLKNNLSNPYANSCNKLFL